MSIRSLKLRADELAGDARDLRTERNRSAERCLSIARRRVGSPAGLTICFGAGVMAGARSRHHRDAADSRNEGDDREDRESFAVQALRGPLGAMAIKLASAFIAGAVMKPEAADLEGV